MWSDRLSRWHFWGWQAIILAAAGLKRLGLADRINTILAPEVSLPAIGQGAIGIECRAADDWVNALLRPLHDGDTAVCVEAERAMNNRLMGGCQVPIAGHATLEGGQLCLRGLVGREDGREVIQRTAHASIDAAESLGHDLATALLAGGADRIHGWMEDWLQCEWWDWKVHTVNVTEQYAQVAVVGPNARKLLEKLGTDMDLSAEALPFMGWAEGEIGGFSTRVFRISFSGELSFEIAVPASQGRAFWDALHAAGEEWNATAYGTEALHIMRAEKGFIMIGDETDGTVIPQDLGLGWAISKKKEDYLGKRAQERSHMTDPTRWKLVGLETVDGSVIPDGSYAIASGTNANGQGNTQGRVTSTYYSPTLQRGIAMGLVLNGPDRMGELIVFNKTDGSTVSAKIVNPVFYDPEGEKQNV